MEYYICRTDPPFIHLPGVFCPWTSLCNNWSDMSSGLYKFADWTNGSRWTSCLLCGRPIFTLWFLTVFAYMFDIVARIFSIISYITLHGHISQEPSRLFLNGNIDLKLLWKHMYEQTVKLVVNLNAVMLKWCYFNFQCIMHCLRYTLTRDLHLKELSLVQVVTDADLLISHHMEMDQWWFIMCNITQWQ